MINDFIDGIFVFAIASNPVEALMLTVLWSGSLIGCFVLGVILEHKRMNKRLRRLD